MNEIDQAAQVIARAEFTALDQNRLVSPAEEVTPELMSNVEAPGVTILQPSHSSHEVRLRSPKH
jgi:hypothetical protein